MKKLTILLKWCVAPFLIITNICLVVTLTSCSSNEPFIAESYHVESDKVNSLAIDVYDRNISVTAGTDNQVKINYFSSSKEFYEMKLSESKELLIKSAYMREWTDFVGTKAGVEYRKINIEVPNNVLSRLSISTTNGIISASTLLVSDNVTFATNGGNIEFDHIGVGNSLVLIAKNGNINGTVIGTYDIFSILCEIKKGQTNIPLLKENGTKALKVNCNNGDVNINFTSN